MDKKRTFYVEVEADESRSDESVRREVQSMLGYAFPQGGVEVRKFRKEALVRLPRSAEDT